MFSFISFYLLFCNILFFYAVGRFTCYYLYLCLGTLPFAGTVICYIGLIFQGPGLVLLVVYLRAVRYP